MMAQEAALKEIASSKLRRISAFKNSFASVCVRVGDEVLFYKASFRTSTLRWRGAAEVLLLAESGATLSFKDKRSRWRVTVYERERAAGESEASSEHAFSDPCRSTSPREETGPAPNTPLGSLDLYKRHIPPSPDALSPDLAPAGKRTRLRAEESQIDIGSPSQDAHRVATDDRGTFDSFDEVCTQTQCPPATRTGYEELSHQDLHDP